MLKNNFEVEVLINGNSVKEYWQNGKVYIEGRKGQEYTIKIINKSWKRAVAIVSVDGLSVIDGEEASHDSNGYVINGYDSIKIKGWRVDDNNVNEFYFSDLDGSYAHKVKKCGNQGIIGVALFFEKEINHSFIYRSMEPMKFDNTPNVPYISPFEGGSTLTAANIGCDMAEAGSKDMSVSVNYCASSSESKAEAKSDLGTGFGKEVHDAVTSVSFERESDHPSEVIELNYASRRSLKEIGIDFGSRPKYVEQTSKAFPGNYCKPPKGHCNNCHGRGAHKCNC